MIRGKVLPLLERPGSSAAVAGVLVKRVWCPSSICWSAYALSYLTKVSWDWRYNTISIRCDGDIATVQNFSPEVEWIGVLWSQHRQHSSNISSSQSYTLYPPLNPSLREPLFIKRVSASEEHTID